MRWMAWLMLVSASAGAQWTLQESHTTASLRGIHSVDGKVAWASGSGGTVLRTVDGGKHWQVCAVPDGDKDGAKLDFRGVQGFDASTAIVMASGKGELSRLYKTVDGCATWKLVFMNPDDDGFWDAVLASGKEVYVLGDPVKNMFALFFSSDAGETWFTSGDTGRAVSGKEGAFAASNSALIEVGTFLYFVTGSGGDTPPQIFRREASCGALGNSCKVQWLRAGVPIVAAGPTAGIFSLAGRYQRSKQGLPAPVLVAVGGIYDRPDAALGTSAFSTDGGRAWTASENFAKGYRSAVAYETQSKAWITVGPNGTDVSFDDGRNWRALKPGVGEPADADKNWNALSLPFVVGAKGRIGVLREGAVKRP